MEKVCRNVSLADFIRNVGFGTDLILIFSMVTTVNQHGHHSQSCSLIVLASMLFWLVGRLHLFWVQIEIDHYSIDLYQENV